MHPGFIAKIGRSHPWRVLAALVLTGAWHLASGSQSLAQPEPSADPECLSVTQSSASTYTISNTACAEQSVLASIELAGGGNSARCFIKKIRTQISIASEGAAPVINYQCIEGATGCSFEVVRDMFPECLAG